MATFVERITGADRSTFVKGRVAGTDLGIPFVLENGASVGYLFGDSFSSPNLGGPDWRSPVAFRSAQDPKTQAIVFDSAYKTPGNANGNILAPDICWNGHSNNDFNPFGVEFTCIPNDGIAFPETGDQIFSFMSINRWKNVNNGNLNGVPGEWRTNYNALAISSNGNDFVRPAVDANYDAIWWNNEQNSDPFQMATYARVGDYVYMISVRAGRQYGPMMLQRVPWNSMFKKNTYQGWNNNGGTWHWGAPGECTSILPQGIYGEPSLRPINGVWVLSYLKLDRPFPYIPAIVTRTVPDIHTNAWTAEKVQVTAIQESSLYGGFIHPWSGLGTNQLIMFVSTMKDNGQTAYHVSQWKGTA